MCRRETFSFLTVQVVCLFVIATQKKRRAYNYLNEYDVNVNNSNENAKIAFNIFLLKMVKYKRDICSNCKLWLILLVVRILLLFLSPFRHPFNCGKITNFFLFLDFFLQKKSDLTSPFFIVILWLKLLVIHIH